MSTVRIPRFAISRAMQLPMPLDAPVMIASGAREGVFAGLDVETKSVFMDDSKKFLSLSVSEEGL
jgi:hypothetical protein